MNGRLESGRPRPVNREVSERGPVDLLHPGGSALPGVSSGDRGSFLGRSPAYTSIAEHAPHRFRDTRQVRRHDVPDPSINL
jgi:hypothetical protein